MKTGTIACALLASAALYATPSRIDTEEARIREAAQKTIDLMQKTQANWKIPCMSCHHQGLGFMALDAARRHGVPVDEAAAHAHAEKVFGMISGAEGALAVGIDSLGLGYGMAAARAAGVPPTLTLRILARRFANWQDADGSWPSTDGRPPHSDSVFTSTALGALAVASYMPPTVAAERDRSLAAARRWLTAARPQTTEDATFRLLGLTWAGAPHPERATAAADLLARQNGAGAWSQVDGMLPDAYATGEALYALRESGSVSPADAAFQRGVAWLLDTQYPDGSWLVHTRLHSTAQISPPFMDVGFPHGKEQYISFAGTAWAALALIAALPETPAPPEPLAIAAAAPKGVEPWMEQAAFGSIADLQRALDAGLDPNATSKGGAPLLALVMPDRAKVDLLLKRGAKPTPQALSAAVVWKGAAPIVARLIERGAPVQPKEGESPLRAAAGSHDVEIVRVLLAHGAEVKNTGAFLSAAQGDDVAMMREVAKAGADVNEADEAGMTPLIWLSLMHKTDGVRAILELGANPGAKDKLGLTALDHAVDIEGADPETARVLRDAISRSARQARAE